VQNNFDKKIFIKKIQKILDSESQLRYSKPRNSMFGISFSYHVNHFFERRRLDEQAGIG